jgi:hypothetical protein
MSTLITERILSAWAYPNTLIGQLVVGLCGRSRFTRKRSDGVRHYVAEVDSPFDRFMLRIGMVAMTLGEVVLYRAGGMTKSTITHEFRHVRQYQLLGPFFLPVYGMASVWSRLRHGSWYKHNPLEEDARKK